MSVSSLMLTDVLTVSDGHSWEALPFSWTEHGDSQLTEFSFVRMPHFNKAREKVCVEWFRSSSNKTTTHICVVGLLNDIWQLQPSVVYPLMDELDDVTWNVQPFHLNRKPLSHSGHLKGQTLKVNISKQYLHKTLKRNCAMWAHIISEQLIIGLYHLTIWRQM